MMPAKDDAAAEAELGQNLAEFGALHAEAWTLIQSLYRVDDGSAEAARNAG